MNFTAPPKPAEFTENQIIDAILSGQIPIGSNLPPERELANQTGVTRPTLREALQRMARDGWLEIRQGKPTRVRDYWVEGNLGVLGAIARRSDNLPPNFVPDLLYVRMLMAPAYTQLAVEHNSNMVIAALEGYESLDDITQAYAVFDWRLHHQLTIASTNPIFTLIINGFRELYQPMACLYFKTEGARAHSLSFYSRLHKATLETDGYKAEAITREIMLESIQIWRLAEGAEASNLGEQDCF